MILGIETAIVCLLMWLLCIFGLGTDQKNLKYFASYPDELQRLLKEDEDYKSLIKPKNEIISFISNFLMYLVLTFLLGIAVRTKGDYLSNFVAILIMGQSINLFDLLIIDLCWFRNTTRSRFSKYPDKNLYKGMKNHLISALKALVMFTLIAAVNGALLMLF